MLKKKIQELLLAEPNQGAEKFEVIHESSASKIVGGTQNCMSLEQCSAFYGWCGALKNCTTYQETT